MKYLALSLLFVLTSFDAFGEDNFLSICASGTLEAVKSHLESGADVYQRNEAEMTSLMVAAYFNSDLRVLKFLMQKNVDIAAKDNLGQNALMLACRNNSNPEVISTLFDAFPDVLEKNTAGETAGDLLRKNKKLAGTPYETAILAKFRSRSKVLTRGGSQNFELRIFGSEQTINYQELSIDRKVSEADAPQSMPITDGKGGLLAMRSDQTAGQLNGDSRIGKFQESGSGSLTTKVPGTLKPVAASAHLSIKFDTSTVRSPITVEVYLDGILQRSYSISGDSIFGDTVYLY